MKINRIKKSASLQRADRKETKCKERGITLIALVVTIIILLILAGVTLSIALSGDGLFNKAKFSSEKYEEASEEEIIQLELAQLQMDDKKTEIGVSLYNKNAENGNKWHLIIDEEKQYGTGYRFIKKGDIINNEKSKYSWIINEKTGEMKKLEEGQYTELSYLDSLGVEKGLIFNLDSSIIDKNTSGEIKDLESQLGNNVKLNGFSDTNSENSGLTSKSFNLDGEDDYIEIDYSNTKDKENLSQNGITFEFYGVVTKGKSHNEKGDDEEIGNNNRTGIFCWYDGTNDRFPGTRFWLERKENQKMMFSWCFSKDDLRTESCDYYREGNEGIVDYPDAIDEGKEVYMSFTLDCKNKIEKDGKEYYMASLFVDGEEKYKGLYFKRLWDKFISNELNDVKKINIGRVMAGKTGWWDYSNMKMYACRLYDRCLSVDEIKLNNEKTRAAHKIE